MSSVIAIMERKTKLDQDIHEYRTVIMADIKQNTKCVKTFDRGEELMEELEKKMIKKYKVEHWNELSDEAIKEANEEFSKIQIEQKVCYSPRQNAHCQNNIGFLRCLFLLDYEKAKKWDEDLTEYEVDFLEDVSENDEPFTICDSPDDVSIKEEMRGHSQQYLFMCNMLMRAKNERTEMLEVLKNFNIEKLEVAQLMKSVSNSI